MRGSIGGTLSGIGGKESHHAQKTFPALLAKLIHASTDKIDSLNVPDIKSSGYDIMLTSLVGNTKSIY